MKRIDIDGGLVQTLAEAPLNTRGGAWSSDGTIVFTHSSIEPLFRIPARGGKAEPATELQAPHNGHRFPRFFPDGRHFMFFAYGPTESQGIYVASLDSKESKRLLDSDSAAAFAPPDYVVFSRQGGVLAQRVDLETFQPIGDPLPVARQAVSSAGTVADVALSGSFAGPLAYRAAAEEVQQRWVDRSGKPMDTLGGPDSGQPGDLSISPDGRTLALGRMVNGNRDLWLVETTRDARQRFTSDPAREFDPVWSPDGTRLVFGSTRKGVLDLYEKSVNGGTETPLYETSESKNGMDWSRDGQWLLFATQSPSTARDLWVLPMKGEKKPVSVAQSVYEEWEARFSPDGKWIAYTSNESGRFEVYVQPFPGPGSRTQISTGGGRMPQWRRDGKELFYVSSNRLMAQSVVLNDSKAEPGTAMALFSVGSPAYALSPDGQRFLINEITKPLSPITILLNWKSR